MSDESERETLLVGALAGASAGALTKALYEMAKELRRYAGSDFDKCFDMLEHKAIRSVENAALDGLAEDDQLRLVEQTRTIISGTFREARRRAH